MYFKMAKIGTVSSVICQVSLVKVSVPKHYYKGLKHMFTEKVRQKMGRQRQKKTDLTPIKNKNNIEIIIRMPSNSNFSFLTIVVLE